MPQKSEAGTVPMMIRRNILYVSRTSRQSSRGMKGRIRRPRFITRYERQDKTPAISFNMNVIRLGDIAIANNPFELYLYYGQNIKARSKAKQTFLVQLSAGASIYAGYLPSPDAEKFGGYGGMIINGQVGSDGGFMLTDITVNEINKLFE